MAIIFRIPSSASNKTSMLASGPNLLKPNLRNAGVDNKEGDLQFELNVQLKKDRVESALQHLQD